MNSGRDEQLRFRPRARIIRAIGDQLISGPEAAVIELVKNAYDADATSVRISFIPPLTQGDGRITVVDDGHGMELSDIQDKWMEPATSSKLRNRRSHSGRRLMMGSKGIGRFAAAKLGERMILRSVNDNADGVRREIVVGEIDWSIFTADTYLSDIAIDFLTQNSDAATGTEIEIRGLAEAWGEDRLKRLLQELRRLISPLIRQDDDPFSIYLNLDACTATSAGFDGARLVNGASDEDGVEWNRVEPFPLMTACDYEVDGRFDDSGVFTGTMQIRRAGQGAEPISLSIPAEDEEDSCGPFDVKLFVFDRETEILKANMAAAGFGQVTVSEARSLLDNVAGIAIYRDGFRVRPYGDLETDWLTLDRERVQDPSLRLGHNQIAGYLSVEGQDQSRLVERSSREGFEENGAYRRLQRLMKTLLAAQVEPRRYAFRERAGIARKRSTTFAEVKDLAGLKRLRRIIDTFPEAEREEAVAVVDQASNQLADRLGVLEERQRLLEASSSLGNIIGEVLHEGSGPAAYIASTSGRLQRLWLEIVQNGGRADAARQDFPKKLGLMKQNGDRLADLFNRLRPLSGAKRGAPVFFRPGAVITDARELFSGHQVSIQVPDALEAPEVIGYRDDLSTAITNLLGNSIQWLEQARIPDPLILIRMTWTDSEVLISVEDNGPGIPLEFVENIFEVGFTTRPGGTGLGLNIARETLARSGAVLAVDTEHVGGARFLIRWKREKAS